MGGFGSGRWQHGKNTTYEFNQLDVRRLHREGFLNPGKRFSWHWKFGNKIITTINIHTEAYKLTLSHKQRFIGNERKAVKYPVSIDWTWCNYGNWRAWFLCPINGCGRRVAILYGGAVFACRHCYKLAYPCQRENHIDRMARRANRIRRRLGWKEGILNPIDVKPKGMHWKTFERLSHQHNLYCSASLDGMRQQLNSFNCFF